MNIDNYQCDGQMDIFDYGNEKFQITKPIRLIELFAGVGSQAMALKTLGADFEHYKVVEFDKYAIKSYNAIHGTNFPTMDITKVHGTDLEIVDIPQYCYVMTYSFPCQDLSVAGKGKGMQKGSGTRSGLLWEVERLLNECEELPQVLLMENVTQVHGKKNMADFEKWIQFLESKGYSNYWKDMNAKEYGVPQNRNRCFMVSILDGSGYEFPKTFELQSRLKDVLEKDVDEKYYLKQIDTEKFHHKDSLIYDKSMLGYEQYAREYNSVMPTITSREYKEPRLVNDAVLQVGNISKSGNWHNPQVGRVYSPAGCSPTLNTCGGGSHEPKIIEPIICAERGRYNGENGGIKQSLEINKVGTSNTLTTVQKDNLVLEPKIIKKEIPFSVRTRKHIVDTDALCECLREHKGNLTNKEISEKLGIPITKVEHWFRKDQSFAIPDENIWMELKKLLEIKTDEFDESILEFETKENCYEKSNRCYHTEGIAPTITNATANEKIIEPQLCIRKLTPKECWRLMDFSDEDFEKAAEVNSNTQLYKQAGNSIVKNCLVAIFGQMIGGKENKYIECK